MTPSTTQTESTAAYPKTTVTMTINAPAKAAFDYLAPINLMRIFPGTSFIAGVADTSVKAGWNKAGMSRTIFFKDGTTSQETLLTWDAPRSFSYTNRNFTSKLLGALLERLDGKWLFTDLKNGTTRIDWTYTAITKGPISKLFSSLVLMKAIHGMLYKALSIGKADLESGELKGLRF